MTGTRRRHPRWSVTPRHTAGQVNDGIAEIDGPFQRSQCSESSADTILTSFTNCQHSHSLRKYRGYPLLIRRQFRCMTLGLVVGCETRNHLIQRVIITCRNGRSGIGLGIDGFQEALVRVGHEPEPTFLLVT